MTKQTTTKKSQALPKKARPVAHGVGRRKKAIARIWIRKGTGKILVNGKLYADYFDTQETKSEVSKPFTIIQEFTKHYDVDSDVYGGGKHGQASAVKLGIARALVEIDENLRPILRQHRLLTVDSRVKERKKYGQRGARRKFQFVKR